jgi:hypothetical protein
VVHNKIDLAAVPTDGRPAGVALSAKTGAGIDSLCSAIAASLIPEPPPAASAVPFTPEHVAALADASQHVLRGDLAAARTALASLLPAGPHYNTSS